MENESGNLDVSWRNLGQYFVGNSEWLAENIKGIDQSVEEMLLLIESDGDSISEKVCPTDHPELIDHIKEICHRHHTLADHYNKLTEELSSRSTPPFLTPVNKPRIRDAGFDLSSLNRGSDSDSETYFMSPSERLSSAPSEKTEKRRIARMGVVEISDYEKEFDVFNGKLISAEEEIVRLKMKLKNHDAVVVKLGNLEAEFLSAKNRIKLQESEMEKESRKSLMLQRKIVDLEAKLETERQKRVQELSGRDDRIQKLCDELQDACGSFALEKWQLDSTVSELSEKLRCREAQCGSLAEVKNRSEVEKIKFGINLEALKITLRDDVERLMGELSDKNNLLDASNQNLDGMKLKYDTVMAEKDRVQDKHEKLEAEVSCLKQNLCESESRIVELEKEVGILGEEKREAIRQLCFAIDHFRCAYEELKNSGKLLR